MEQPIWQLLSAANSRPTFFFCVCRPLLKDQANVSSGHTATTKRRQLNFRLKAQKD